MSKFRWIIYVAGAAMIALGFSIHDIVLGLIGAVVIVGAVVIRDN